MDEGAKELFEAQAHLYKLIFNYASSMALKCAVELGIPDMIQSHGKHITLSELASALDIHPTKTSSLFRIMSLLVHSGLFSTTKVHNDQKEEEAYTLTPSSTLLLNDKSYCLSPYIMAPLDPAVVTPSHLLSSWLRGNELTAFETAHGMNLWDYMGCNPAFNTIFNQSMASDSQMSNLVVENFTPILEGLDSLVDVGGGTGTFSRIISETLPGIKCTVLDLPHVVANLPDTENLKFMAGDMFQSIPPADAFLFKMVFHIFDDEGCLKLLKKCREAFANKAERGKVIIIDIVMNKAKDEPELTEAKLLYDTILMVLVPSKERNEKEWKKLFLEAGFSHYKITPMFGIRSLIEVYP